MQAPHLTTDEGVPFAGGATTPPGSPPPLGMVGSGNKDAATDAAGMATAGSSQSSLRSSGGSSGDFMRHVSKEYEDAISPPDFQSPTLRGTGLPRGFESCPGSMNAMVGLATTAGDVECSPSATASERPGGLKKDGMSKKKMRRNSVSFMSTNKIARVESLSEIQEHSGSLWYNRSDFGQFATQELRRRASLGVTSTHALCKGVENFDNAEDGTDESNFF